jgi:hypothetical protein
VSAIYGVINISVIRGADKNTIRLVIIVAEERLKYFNNNIGFSCTGGTVYNELTY